MCVLCLGSLPEMVNSQICKWCVNEEKETARQVAVGEGRLSRCVPGDCVWPNYKSDTTKQQMD